MGATDLPRSQNALGTGYSSHGVTPSRNLPILAKLYKISQTGDFTAEGEFETDIMVHLLLKPNEGVGRLYESVIGWPSTIWVADGCGHADDIRFS